MKPAVAGSRVGELVHVARGDNGRFAYIGDNRGGDHCRIQYFTGARRTFR